MPTNKSHSGGLLNGKKRLFHRISPAARARAFAVLSDCVLVFGMCLLVALGAPAGGAEALSLKSEGRTPGTTALRVNAEWNPRADLPGCILWLDAGDVAGSGNAGTVSSPAAVALWADKSGYHHHAAQPTPAHQPTRSGSALGGRSVLRFAGGQYLTNSLSLNWSAAEWELFVVASLDGNAPDQWRGIVGNRFGAGKDHWWTLGTRDSGGLYLELGAGNGPSPACKVRDFGRQIYHVSKAGAQFALRRNGASSGTATQPDVGGLSNELRIGSWFAPGQEWQGEIAEIILYQRTLAQAERDAVDAYLACKWSVTLWEPLYARRATWIETQLATREAYGRQALGNGQSAENTGEDLWPFLERDFTDPESRKEMAAERADRIWHFVWQPGQWAELARRYVEAARGSPRIQAQMAVLAPAVNDLAGLNKVRALYHRPKQYAELLSELKTSLNLRALRLALVDLTETFPDRYLKGPEYLRRLDVFEKDYPKILDGLAAGEESAKTQADELLAFQREALFANPLLDFDRLLLVKRHGSRLGLPQNWQSNASLPRTGWDNELAVLSPVRPEGQLTTLYRPAGDPFVGDVDLDFSGEKLLFSSIDTDQCWQVFEINADGTGLRQVTPHDPRHDVHYYDACYLPDGRIMFASTAGMAAVACVNGCDLVATLYRIDADGRNLRQLCFDQEQNWCATVLNDGRVLYQRWEYTDTPHAHARLLFSMNPDGTEQKQLYGSNSYWPNAMFYARPLPGHLTRVVAIVGGHHGVPRMGELVILDPAQGRWEADGVVQRIPGRGQKVEARIEDNLVDNSWPKFLHPYPLSEKYFLVACQPTAAAPWGICLVDVFDNRLLLKELPGYALFEPIPFRPTPRPPVIPDRVDPKRKDALVYLSDVYAGDGLKGIPRGTVRSLRLFSYHYLYPGMGGPQGVVGLAGPWDIKRVLGTVPVEADGSAYFRVPAQTPIAVQPLDAEGKALQLMRSWFTGMPGEVVSCAGCHESQNATPPNQQATAIRRAPSEITPWHGPVRGFNFAREVQPVLDRYCVSCHDGRRDAQDRVIADLRGTNQITDYTSVFHSGGRDAGHFSVSYAELHRYVRRSGLESDYHLLTPMEFHADTTQLVQLLKKGHHGVTLDAEAWDRLITWIDLNAPFHGTYGEIAGPERVQPFAQRRRELLQRYADMDEDPEAIPVANATAVTPVQPKPSPTLEAQSIRFLGWPFDAAEAKRRQTSAGLAQRRLELAPGIAMELVPLPAGEFVMGEASGCPDEQPPARVRIEKAFWMGRLEVSNEQFGCFDAGHDSGVESRFSMQFGVRGFYVNGPRQPVVRVSWQQAMAFCDWLSRKSGQRVTLPTEAQWEYACRAGTAAPFYYGGVDADFSKFANLADVTLREYVCNTYSKAREPWLNASKYDDWTPKDTRFNDGGFLADRLGGYQPNAWGLHDLHGNVAEWTRSAYRPYPYRDGDGRNRSSGSEKRVARGGSWRDRPAEARSAYRQAYEPYQPVFNVGFRVVMEAAPAQETVLQTEPEGIDRSGG